MQRQERSGARRHSLDDDSYNLRGAIGAKRRFFVKNERPVEKAPEKS